MTVRFHDITTREVHEKQLRNKIYLIHMLIVYHTFRGNYPERNFMKVTHGAQKIQVKQNRV